MKNFHSIQSKINLRRRKLLSAAGSSLLLGGLTPLSGALNAA